MTQGPSVLPNNFTPLFAPGRRRLTVPAGCCCGVSQLVQSKGKLSRAAVTDTVGVLIIVLSHSSDELWNIPSIISAILDRHRRSAVGLPYGSQRVCGADEAISSKREWVPSNALKSRRPKREEIVQGWTDERTAGAVCSDRVALLCPLRGLALVVTRGFSNYLKFVAYCEGNCTGIHSYITSSSFINKYSLS